MKYFKAQSLLSSKRNKRIAITVALLVCIAGLTIVITRAGGFFVGVTPSQGTISGNAVIVTEPDGSKTLQFRAPSSPPPPTPPPTTPPPPTTGWPNASNVGLRTSTTRTMGGETIDNTSWFSEKGFPGAGTESNPYLVDRVLFTSQVTLGNWDSSNLSGKWVKFTNCRFFGSPGNPTPGGSAALFARDNAPFFIIESSTLGPNLPILASGATEKGTNFGLFSYVPFKLLSSNVYGANILVGFETERSEKTGVLIENNYIHDVFSAAGDHTDIINGNFHASHVVVRNNYLDGIRTGNSYVANAFGIYDDPPTSAGIIENWTIDHNYIDRAATLLLSSTSKSRFLDPFIVTNNTWGRFSVQGFAGRTPSVQSGNVDLNGKAQQF